MGIANWLTAAVNRGWIVGVSVGYGEDRFKWCLDKELLGCRCFYHQPFHEVTMNENDTPFFGGGDDNGEKGRVRRVILASPSSLAFFGD